MGGRRQLLAIAAALGCAAFPGAAQAACNAAASATYNVSTAADNELDQPEIPGSLRYVLSRASAGSVIGFCENFLIALQRPIRIREAQKGLQLVGPSTLMEAAPHEYDGEMRVPRAVLNVEAEDVVVQGLTFANVALYADRSASGLKILGNDMTVRAPSHRGTGAVIDLAGRVDEELRDVQIGSREEPNRIVSDQTDAISSLYTRRLKVVGNTIDGSAGSFAWSDNESTNLLAEANTILGPFAGELVSGRILDNTFTTAKVQALRVFHDIERYGPLKIAGNVVSGGGGIRIERDGVEVEGNTVTGSRAPGILMRCEGAAVAPVRIAGNVLEGNRQGLLYACGPKASRATIARNRITGNRGDGISVSGVRVTVRGGSISDNGGAGVLVLQGSLARVSRVRFGGNAKRGIELAARANRNIGMPAPLVFDPGTGRITGKVCGGCLVEVFRREEGRRTGNPRHGEGVKFLAALRAARNGRFAYPASGRLTCEEAQLITTTATDLRHGAVTSEFSRDPSCGEATVDTTVGEPQISGGGPIRVGQRAGRSMRRPYRGILQA